MARKKQDTIYATIMDPVNFRRELLYSVKLLLTSLKSYHELQEIRKEKLKKFLEVQDKFKEIDSLFMEFKSLFPELPKGHKVISQKVNVEKIKTERIEPPKHSSELDKLEQELMEVEEELKRLN